jgi:hypothetical protein
MTNNSIVFNKKLIFQSGDIILTILFFISISLTVWGINIYRLTIIETKYLFATIMFGIVVGFVVLSFLVKSSYSFIWTFLIKAAISAGLVYFAFLYFNQIFADKELQREQFLIVKKGTLGRGKRSSCSQPYVNISFYGIEKQLVFYCQFADTVKKSTKVNLTYSKGLFGFNIIKSKQLTD